MMASPQNRKRATWAAIAFGCVSGFEGLRTSAYFDVGRVPTVCYGETRGVKMTDHKTPDECKGMLIDRLEEFNDGVNFCVRVPMSDNRRAGVVSFFYNVGIGAGCKSTFVRKLNAGDPYACDELLKWNKITVAGKPVVIRGLTKRREAERELCLA